MEEKSCYPCEQEVITKYPACPLQCMSPKCKAYKGPPIDPSKTPIIWVLGGPGSGKGTQCEKIITKYGFKHFSTGDLLRAEAQSGSDRAQCLTTIMQRGELVPNDVVLDLLKEAMIAQAESAKGFLIDGYPREKSQGIAFEKFIAPVSVIIYFEASSETLMKRLMSRCATSDRIDDNEDSIKLRLNTFHAHNDLVLAQYHDKIRRVRHLTEGEASYWMLQFGYDSKPYINAENTVEAIFAQVEQIIDPLVA